MIVIPNMEKPKNCFQCSFNDGIYCALIDNDTDAFISEDPTKVSTKRLDTCPLIEIITCGECKHMRKYALRSDEPTGIWCHRWSVPRLVTDDDFCSYGERRADERLYKER